MAHHANVNRGKKTQRAFLNSARPREVVRASTLEKLGTPRSTIYGRCRPGGPWRRLLPGIIQLDPFESDDEQRIAAALLRGGPGSMITGLWAADRHGLERIPEPTHVHILVPAARQVNSAEFVLVERTTRLPIPQVREGTPLAPVHRAVLDAARRMHDFDAIRALLAEAIQRRRCTPRSLARELERGCQRGTALPRRAIIELLGGAQSVAEGDAFWLWKRAGLPDCERNVAIFDDNNGYIATPDAWVDEVAFAWEIDSREFHFDIEGYASTLARNARYAAAGIVVVQTLPSRIRNEPEAVIAELRNAFEAASRRPRPFVRKVA